MFEKAGGMLKNDGMVEKGQAKRANAGNDDAGGYSGSGSGNNNY